MKRKDLISKIISMGCVFLRHGGNHDLYQNPKTLKKQPVPGHREIDEQLARPILKEVA